MSRTYDLKEKLSSRAYIGVFILRFFVGLRLLYGVIDNIVSWERMIEFSGFLHINGFPFPVISAILSVYIQAIGGLLILIGYHIRLASLVLVINFIIAALVHIRLGDSIEAMTPALAILFCCLAFIFMGSGKLSISKP
ncbi:DoxX family protein [Aquimarina sp. Aq78]|uniref:DoxX family protein n=1 Tax=Aquimarina sp. Aq78 TaxID=1191889 RepID=UPI000D10B169|nr:DoxX family protein [Aquimarina sp. Aq78]